MKHLLFAFLVVLLDALGCSPRREPFVLNAYPKAVMFGSQQVATETIDITCSSEWKVGIEGEQWLEVRPTSGQGDGKITVTAKSSNESRLERTCNVLISGTNQNTAHRHLFDECARDDGSGKHCRHGRQDDGRISLQVVRRSKRFDCLAAVKRHCIPDVPVA